MQTIKQGSEGSTLALKPVTSPEVQNRGISGHTKWTDVLQNIFLKNRPFAHFHVTSLSHSSVVMNMALVWGQGLSILCTTWPVAALQVAPQFNRKLHNQADAASFSEWRNRFQSIVFGNQNMFLRPPKSNFTVHNCFHYINCPTKLEIGESSHCWLKTLPSCHYIGARGKKLQLHQRITQEFPSTCPSRWVTPNLTCLDGNQLAKIWSES